MIPFYVNEIGKYNLKRTTSISLRAENEEKRRQKNEKMEAVVSSCIESLKLFQEIKIGTFQSWKQLSRLCDRSIIFEIFLKDLHENSTMLNDLSDSENEILLGLQKCFRLIEKLIEDVIKRNQVKGFTEPQVFQAHISDIATANGFISQYGQSLNLFEDQEDLTQIRNEDLEVRSFLVSFETISFNPSFSLSFSLSPQDIKETFKFAVTETLREINVEGMDPTKRDYSIANEIKDLQRDIHAAEDAVIKMLSLRKARALSVFEARALKGELQKLSLMVNEKGAEMEYTRKQHDLLDQSGVNISTDFEDRDEIIIGEITKNFIYRFNKGALSNNDHYRKKEYIERQRLLYDEVLITDTILTTWSMGDVMLGKFHDHQDVAIKTMTTDKHKYITDNKIRLLENELLTLQYLNKASLTTPTYSNEMSIGAPPHPSTFLVNCFGALVKGNSSIQLIMELAPYGSLEDVLYDEKLFATFPIALKLSWICDLSEALYYIQRKEVIHGNIQAKNLLVFEKMKIKLGNFHLLRTSLKTASNRNKQSPEKDAMKMMLQKDEALPFLPPEARSGDSNEVDLSFDIFSFAMTVVQILTRKKPLLDNFQQQIVHALHVAGLNAMDIRNRLFALLSDCVKFDPSLNNNNGKTEMNRPSGDKIRTEMNQILKILGGDPRSHESQRSYMVKLEDMALQKRKQKERKKGSPMPETYPPATAEMYSTQSITTASLISSISDEAGITPEEDEDDFKELPEKISPPTPPHDTLSNWMRSAANFPKSPPLSGSTSGDSITPKNNQINPRLSKSNDSNRLSVRNAKPLNRAFSLSNDSYSTMDDEHISVLAQFIREKTHCTNNYAKLSAQILVKNGILDASILKRRLQRDRDLLIKLNIEDELAEDLYEVLIDNSGNNNMISPSSSSSLSPTITPPNRISSLSRNPSSILRNNNHNYSQRFDQSISTVSFRDNGMELGGSSGNRSVGNNYYDNNYNNNNNNELRRSRSLFSIISSTSEKRRSSNTNNGASNGVTNMNSLTYCRSEQSAAEIANLYYEASQCRNTKALNKLKHYVSEGDQIAEGFLMRVIALGQCGEKRDKEKASKMGNKLFPWFQLLLETGTELRSIYARYHLAVCYSEGLGVEQDHRLAANWYKESAERGYAGAQAYLGYCYYLGIGVEKNHSEAVRWYRIAADQGFSGAQSNLGICYEHGHGVEKNMELAVKYYRLSAEQGASSAQYNLGNCYERGEGIEQNFYESYSWYLQSVEQGYTPAEYALGCYYLVGLGCEIDLNKGIQLLTSAAEKNYILAQVKLGECYEEGKGVQCNPIKAMKLYSQAAENGGNPTALYKLGYYHFYGITVERDLSKAVDFYTLAAERSHPLGQHHLGICYYNGFGVKKDLTIAFRWFKASADAGYAQGQYQVASMYEYGKGVSQDIQTAIKYYKLSAKNQNPNAMESLKRLKIDIPLEFGHHPNQDIIQVETFK